MGNLIMIGCVAFMAISLYYGRYQQKKRDREHAQMLEKLQVGDRIRIVNGMKGTVTEIGDDWIRVDFSPDGIGSVIEVSKEAFLAFNEN